MPSQAQQDELAAGLANGEPLTVLAVRLKVSSSNSVATRMSPALNAPSHTCKLAQEAYESYSHDVRIVFQPPLSPDLTPLDWWTWAAVKQELYAGHEQNPPWGNSLPALRAYIQRAYDKVVREQFHVVEKLPDSFYCRLQRCIAVRGGAFETK